MRRPRELDAQSLHPRLVLFFEENTEPLDLRDPGEDRLTQLLVEAVGLWIGGWRFGGPSLAIAARARPTTEIPHTKATTPEEKADNVLWALRNWMATLDWVDSVFETLGDAVEPAALESAAARILALLVEDGDFDDAWYYRFHRLYMWYLQSLGVPTELIEADLERIAEGRFESWVGPQPQAAALAGADLAQLVVQSRPWDALESWRVARGYSPEGLQRPADVVVADGHRAFVSSVDAARSEARAFRMTKALARCRQSASRGDDLDWVALREWQTIVLGTEASFREQDAYARGGNLRYPTASLSMFEGLLLEANSDEPAVIRAARVYLDICFFHPFDDGNGRSARLAMDHVLARANLAIRAPKPVFQLLRGASPSGLEPLVRTLASVVGRQGPDFWQG
ncbi:MAG: Fic family protein [Myxococcota bacterium]